MKAEDFYESLIGKNKKDILILMDMPHSPYDSDEWIYITGKNFFGLNKKLYLFFSDNHVYDFFASSWA